MKETEFSYKNDIIIQVICIWQMIIFTTRLHTNEICLIDMLGY